MKKLFLFIGLVVLFLMPTYLKATHMPLYYEEEKYDPSKTKIIESNQDYVRC